MAYKNRDRLKKPNWSVAFCVKGVMDAILHLLECMEEFRDGDLMGSVDVPASHQKDELVVR